MLEPVKHHSGLQLLSEPFDPKTKIIKSVTLSLNVERDILSPNDELVNDKLEVEITQYKADYLPTSMLKLIALNKLGPFKRDPVPCYAKREFEKLRFVLKESEIESEKVYC